MILERALITVKPDQADDFVKATQRVYFGGADGSKIELRVDQ